MGARPHHGRHPGRRQPGLEVRQLYFQDYLRQWDALLADIDFVAITSTAQAADVLRVLSGPQSPLKKLLEAVAKETDLQKEERLAAEKLKGTSDTVGKLKDRLGSLVGQGDDACNSRRRRARTRSPRTSLSSTAWWPGTTTSRRPSTACWRT